MQVITHLTFLIMTNGMANSSLDDVSANVIDIEATILINAVPISLVRSKTLFQDLALSDNYLALVP